MDEAHIQVALTIRSASDIDRARREARRLAEQLGFDRYDAERIVLSALELAHNLVDHARSGRLTLQEAGRDNLRGVLLMSEDDGPGITDRAGALRDGTSTAGGLGSGLPAIQRLMDEFELDTSDAGTRVVAYKWLRHPR